MVAVYVVGSGLLTVCKKNLWKGVSALQAQGSHRVLNNKEICGEGPIWANIQQEVDVYYWPFCNIL